MIQPDHRWIMKIRPRPRCFLRFLPPTRPEPWSGSGRRILTWGHCHRSQVMAALRHHGEPSIIKIVLLAEAGPQRDWFLCGRRRRADSRTKGHFEGLAECRAESILSGLSFFPGGMKKKSPHKIDSAELQPARRLALNYSAVFFLLQCCRAVTLSHVMLL